MPKPGDVPDDLVLFEPLVQRLGLRRAVDRHADRAFLLLALIVLDRRRHLVAGVDLGMVDRVAVDQWLRVGVVEIILLGRAQHRADDLRRPGAVAGHADHDLLLLGRRRSGEPQPGRRAYDERQRRRRYAGHLGPPSVAPWLIGKWPYAEVVADVAPQPIQAVRLDDQEEDDQAAEDHQPQVGDDIIQIGLGEE